MAWFHILAWAMLTAAFIATPTLDRADAADGAAAPSAAEAAEAKAAADAAARFNLVGHGGPVKAVATHPGKTRALTGSFDYAMMAWDLSGEFPKPLTRYDDHDGAVNAVAFLPDGLKALSAGDDGRLSLWDLEKGELITRFEGHAAKIVDIAVSQDGAFALTASWDRTARLWNLAKGKEVHVFEEPKGPVNAVAFSRDGDRVFTANYDGKIRMYEAGSGRYVRQILSHGWGINVLEPIPEADQLLFGALNGTAAVIDIESGETVAELGASDRPILAIAVVRQPGLAAIGDGEGRVRVFRLGDFQPIEEYQNPYGPAWALAFAPGGAALYIAGLDDFVARWTITPRDPFETIESPFPRRFQVSEDSEDPVAQGRSHFARKCSVCHTLKSDGKNRAGPTLYGLFGRRIGTLPGYPYSESLKKLDIVWTPETVSKLFELGPENFTPGSKMPLQKMTDKAQRDALIAYLMTTEATAATDNSGSAGKGN